MISIEEFKKKIDKSSRLLGIDPGKKRVGIAITDTNKTIATPLSTLNKDTFSIFLKELNKIINEYDIRGIIIGNPLNMDGSKSSSTQSANDFAVLISKKVSLPVALWDERLSTSAAYNLSSPLDVNTSKIKKKIDQNAAAFMLQGAIDYIRK